MKKFIVKIICLNNKVLLVNEEFMKNHKFIKVFYQFDLHQKTSHDI